jgi:glycoprotein endo-alpha-1,2-mannosidase
MRRLLLFVLLALVLPGAASAAAPRVSAFYYPWYGMPSKDGSYQHWDQAGHAPPTNIASAYYPLRGVYSSSDALVVSAQMDEIRSAGIDQIDVSWWGQGSAEDQRMPLVLADARLDGITVAAHLEPYGDRSVASTVADIQYLEQQYGIRTFYVYRAPDFPASEWAAAQPQIHAGGGVTVYAQTGMVGWAAAAGFDGVYTYDIVTFGGNMFHRFCGEARKKHLLCAPSVGPGYDAKRGDGDTHYKPRRNGATYDAMWRAAIASSADQVTITSFNEWHEGTQIEPAAPPRRRGSVRYLSYEGAWGLHGPQAEFAYLARTRYWSDIYKSTVAAQPSTSAS